MHDFVLVSPIKSIEKCNDVCSRNTMKCEKAEKERHANSSHFSVLGTKKKDWVDSGQSYSWQQNKPQPDLA